MDPKYAVKNVMCDRIGMDKSAYNQMNSLKRDCCIDFRICKLRN